MLNVSSSIITCIAGTDDFVRRSTAAITQHNNIKQKDLFKIIPTNLAEARSIMLTEKPNVLIVDIGLKTTRKDIVWLRSLLNQLRERFGKRIYIIIAITSPEKFVFGGTLLFQSEESLEPSGLVDNLIITPPPGIPSVLTLEQQLIDCLTFVTEVLDGCNSDEFPLPALWDSSWVPVMGDSESRNVWMRWVPRYARYVNENPIIVGPTGSGKTRLAAAIHDLSGRKGPFISVTPRDFSSTELVQAELFGAVAGAYTGAVDKWGLVKQAEKGTLFIDELQSIDRDLQGKLITFIENKSYRRVGEAESHTADVRFIFATNRSLQDLVNDGSLRDDFAYRLERLQITLSPLHNRRLDIAAGICFALGRVLRERAQARSSYQDNVDSNLTLLDGLTAEAYRTLFCSPWPGNLRQLENTVAKLVELADIKNFRLIDEECTGGAMQGLLGQTEPTAADVFEKAAIQVALWARTRGYDNLQDFTFELEDNARLAALDITGGNLEKAAELINDSINKMRLFATNRI